jgi:hypothetical protein
VHQSGLFSEEFERTNALEEAFVLEEVASVKLQLMEGREKESGLGGNEV